MQESCENRWKFHRFFYLRISLLAALLTWAERSQEMPVIDPKVVSVLPLDGHGIRTNRFDLPQSSFGRIGKCMLEYILIRFGAHILMPAAARGAWAGRPKQAHRIHTGMTIRPANGQFASLPVGGDSGRRLVGVHRRNFLSCITAQGSVSTRLRKFAAAQPLRVTSYGASRFHQTYPSASRGPSITLNTSASRAKNRT